MLHNVVFHYDDILFITNRLNPFIFQLINFENKMKFIFSQLEKKKKKQRERKHCILYYHCKHI